MAADGAYCGGIIAPGINLSLDALVNATAQLPRIAIAAPEVEDVIGRTTESQMLIGIYWGYDGAKGLGTPPRFFNQIVRKIAIENNKAVSQWSWMFPPS